MSVDYSVPPTKYVINCGGGNIEYYRVNGVLHRMDGPAMITARGVKKWYYRGFLHREDGPAIDWADGGYEYWFYGMMHRDDGPAIDYPMSSGWFYDGKEYTFEEFIAKADWSDDDVVQYKLTNGAFPYAKQR